MKRHRHSPEQALYKVREGERLLNEGKDLTEVLRTLEEGRRVLCDATSKRATEVRLCATGAVR